MPRPKKDARILNIKLDSSVYDKLNHYCENTGHNKTETVEKALDAYLNSVDIELEANKNKTGESQ